MSADTDDRRESAGRWLNLENRESNWLIIGAVAIAALVVLIAVRSARRGDDAQAVERQWKDLRDTAGLALENYRVETAVTAAEAAVSLADSKFGDPNPAIAESCRQLAQAYMMAGEYAAAERVAARGVGNYVALLGPADLETAAVTGEYGMILARLGRFTEALPLLERAVQVCEQVAGPEASATATAVQNLAEMRTLEQQAEKALPLYERALAIHSKTAGPAGLATAEAMAGLAACLTSGSSAADANTESTATATAERAASLLERSLLLQQRAVGTAHRRIAPTLLRLAALRQFQQKTEQAEATALEALAVYESKYGPRHPETATALLQLATLLENRGELAVAQQCLDRAAVICNNSLGLRHPKTIAALAQLIAVLFAREDYKTAEKPCLARLTGLKETEPQDADAIRQATEQVAAVFEKTGRIDEAKKLRETANLATAAADGAESEAAAAMAGPASDQPTAGTSAAAK